jgi:hypothetical protein
MNQTKPPLDQPLSGSGWWGCAEWLVRGSAPPNARESSSVKEYVAQLEGIATKNVEFGPVRWRGQFSVRDFNGGRTYAVDTDYLDFCEAEAKVAEWRTVRLRTRQQVASILVGINRSKEPVAIVAPIHKKLKEKAAA